MIKPLRKSLSFALRARRPDARYFDMAFNYNFGLSREFSFSAATLKCQEGQVGAAPRAFFRHHWSREENRRRRKVTMAIMTTRYRLLRDFKEIIIGWPSHLSHGASTTP